MKMKRRKVEGQNRLEENVKRKIWTMNKELKQRKLAIKVLELGCKPIRDFFFDIWDVGLNSSFHYNSSI